MVELLVTMAVTLIALVGLLALLVSANRGERSAREIAEATALAESTLEQYRGESVDTLVQSGGGAFPAVIDPGTVTGQRGVIFQRSLTLEEVGEDNELVRLRVSVVWGENGAAIGGDDDHEVTLELVRTLSEAP